MRSWRRRRAVLPAGLAALAGILAAGAGIVGPTTGAAAAATAVPAANVLDVDFAGGSVADHAQGLAETTYGAPVVGPDQSLGKDVATFNGTSDAYAYDFRAQWPGLLSGSGVTAECVMRYNGTFSASTASNVCSGATGGGMSIVVHDATVSFSVYIGGAYREATAPITAGTWYDVVGVYDGSTVTLYVDGVQLDQEAVSGTFTAPPASGQKFVLGAGPTGGVSSWTPASISASRVWSTPLSAAQVQALYASNGSPGGGYTAPVQSFAATATANATSGSALVSWPTVSGATGYSVYSSATPGGEDTAATPACTSATTSCTVTGLSDGDAYYFVVVATGQGGIVGKSAEASATEVPVVTPDLSPFMTIAAGAEGTAVNGDDLYELHSPGTADVYDLSTKSHIGSFDLGSYNDGTPDSRYTNHANSAMFSDTFYDGNTIPLLYVVTGDSGDSDSDGDIGRCAAENITKTTGSNGTVSFSSQDVQTIIWNDAGIGDTQWASPGWGWPACFVDSQHGWFYLFSARQRTTCAVGACSGGNDYVVTKFALPAVTTPGQKVVLTATDIVDQFTTPYDIAYTQGGTMFDGRILYTFGSGTASGYPDGIRVFDTGHKDLASDVDLSQSPLAAQEIESDAVYDGSLLITTAEGDVYQVVDVRSLWPSTVTGVAVTPGTATVQQGSTQPFSAAVTGDLDQGVTWSVSGNANPGTTVSSSGVLTVAAGETAATLTVTAASRADPSKSGTATVSVVPPPPALTFTTPAGGTTVSGTVPVSVTLSGSDLQAYDLRIDSGGLQYAWQPTPGTLTFQLDTTALGNGVHTLLATATNTAGEKTTVTQKIDVANPAAWTSQGVYLAGDQATSQGSVWQALWWTQDQAPGSPTGPWEQMITSPDGTAVWTATRVFSAGDDATYDGHLYQAQWYTRDQQPGTEYGPWKQLS